MFGKIEILENLKILSSVQKKKIKIDAKFVKWGEGCCVRQTKGTV